MATSHVDLRKYRRVRAEEEDGAAREKRREAREGPEDHVRVTAQRGQRAYISYAIALLTGAEGKTQQDTIKISGMGAAISSAVNVAELVKRRVKGLHQITHIDSEVVKDSYESIETKEKLEVERSVPTVLITLSTKALDTKALGYQAPLPDSMVSEQEERAPAERRSGSGRDHGRSGGSSRGRGGRGGRGTASGGRGGGASSRGGGRGGRGGDSGRGGRGSARGGRGTA